MHKVCTVYTVCTQYVHSMYTVCIVHIVCTAVQTVYTVHTSLCTQHMTALHPSISLDTYGRILYLVSCILYTFVQEHRDLLIKTVLSLQTVLCEVCLCATVSVCV